ncbi:DMT family transporter [Oceaniradius stylonematis]|uniref:DMT family transporter n=1 Tax=Oceaniradius stylonematis TaxID=2184161 RepID=A0A3A8A8A2_9HYPH|nr:DMT family transporter [Oceaniradius stylonematis]RKF06136.1 DMT family transporter [Oceaniradius stylonematis]
MQRATANALLLVTGAVWGMGFVAQSTAMDPIGPVFFTGVRFFAAALAVAPLALWEARRARAAGSPPLTPRQWGSFGVLGTLLFASLAAQQIGLLTTTVTNSGFLTGTYVVFVPVLVVLALREFPHPVVWPAAVLTLGGIWLLSGGALSGLTEGDLWTLLCAVLWACHVIALGRFVKGAPRPFTLAFTQFAVCGVIGCTIAPFIEPVSLDLIVAAAPEIAFAGIVSGGIAFTIQAVAQRHTTAPQAAIFMSTEAPFAALFGALFLAERIPAIGIVGCALIFTAILAVELVPMLRPARRSTVHEP